jgi:hypothetical protein
MTQLTWEQRQKEQEFIRRRRKANQTANDLDEALIIGFLAGNVGGVYRQTLASEAGN